MTQLRTRLAACAPLWGALAALVLALLLAACGEKDDVIRPSGSSEVAVVLDSPPAAEHAGLYAAQAGGDFREAGLDVTIDSAREPGAAIGQVAAGDADLALAREPELLSARDEGVAVIAVASVVRAPLTSIVSLPNARIGTPRDLAGTTVGTTGADYQADFLRAIVDRAGIDPQRVQRVDVGFALNDALLGRRVGATLGGGWNQQALDLRLRGRAASVIRVGEAGIPTYDELVLVANEDALEREGGRLRAFIAALGRGTETLRRQADPAVRRLTEASPSLDAALARAAVRQTLPLLMPPRDEPFGAIDGEAWQEFVAWMNDNELLENTPDASGAYTQEYLPGAGL